ncbi:MAG: hypothetical protein PUB39_05085 [Eubacteriales bacterium]|nr:hypothetical protein [Eubacteriales bacterium]
MGLKAGENFTTIARRIDSNRTTVSREVKARRIPVHNSRGNRWNTMRNWHSRITKLSVPNRAEGSLFRRMN